MQAPLSCHFAPGCAYTESFRMLPALEADSGGRGEPGAGPAERGCGSRLLVAAAAAVLRPGDQLAPAGPRTERGEVVILVEQRRRAEPEVHCLAEQRQRRFRITVHRPQAGEVVGRDPGVRPDAPGLAVVGPPSERGRELPVTASGTSLRDRPRMWRLTSGVL